MQIVPFTREHLARISLAEWQEPQRAMLDESSLALIEGLESYTILDGNEVLVCAGIVEISIGRALVWSYISKDIGRRMLFATRAAKRFFSMTDFRRIEIDVASDFPQAHRWARTLGFEMECERRRKYSYDGSDCALYAMVR